MVVNNRTTVAAKKQATETATKVITPVKKEKYKLSNWSKLPIKFNLGNSCKDERR